MGGFFEKDVTPLTVRKVLTMTEPTIRAHTFHARHCRSANILNVQKFTATEFWEPFFFLLSTVGKPSVMF